MLFVGVPMATFCCRATGLSRFKQHTHFWQVVCMYFCGSNLHTHRQGSLVQGLLWKVHYRKKKYPKPPSRLTLPHCLSLLLHPLSHTLCISLITLHIWSLCWHSNSRGWELNSSSPYWVYDRFTGSKEFIFPEGSGAFRTILYLCLYLQSRATEEGYDHRTLLLLSYTVKDFWQEELDVSNFFD